MLEGRCPRCKQVYYGLALANPRYQTCDRCGAALEIKDGDKVIKGFSPFDNSNLNIKPRHRARPQDKSTDKQP